MRFKIPKPYWYLALIYFTPRLGYWLLHFLRPQQVSIDHLNHYWGIADSLLRNGHLELEAGKATTQVEPLYSIFIAASRLFSGGSIHGVLLIQIIFCFIGLVYFYRLSKIFLGDSKAAFVAAVIYACSPYQIRACLKINEAPFFRVLLVAASYYSLSMSKTAVNTFLSGLLWGLCLVTRSMVLPAVIILAARLLFLKKVRSALIFTAGALLVCSPMFIYNFKTDGSLFPTRGGINFYLGNSHYYSRLMPLFHVDHLESYAYEELGKNRPDLIHASDKKKDAYFYQKGFEFIVQNPQRFLKFKALNVTYFFSPIMIPIHPLGNSSIMVKEDGSLNIEIMNAVFPGRGAFEIAAHSLFRGTLLLLGLLGIALRIQKLIKGDFVFLVLLANFLLVYTLFWPSTRLYSPVMFVLMLYAAYALKRLIPEGSKFWQFVPIEEGVDFDSRKGKIDRLA